MNTISATKLAGISLIVGPVITLAGYFIQQLVIFADAEWGSAASFAAAAASDSGLMIATSLLVSLGLMMLAYGFLFIVDGIRGNGNGDALARYAQLLVLVGTVGFVLGQGVFVTAATFPDPAAAAEAAFLASSGIINIAGIIFSLGFAAVFLAMGSRDEYNKLIANLAGLVAVVAFVLSVIGLANTDLNQQMTQLVGLTYIVHSIYAIYIGWGLFSKK